MMLILIHIIKEMFCSNFHSNPSTEDKQNDQEKVMHPYDFRKKSKVDSLEPNQHYDHETSLNENCDTRSILQEIYLEIVNDFLKEQGYDLLICNACINDCNNHDHKCILNANNLKQEDKDIYNDICKDIKSSIDKLAKNYSDDACITSDEREAIKCCTKYILGELFANFANFPFGPQQPNYILKIASNHTFVCFANENDIGFNILEAMDCHPGFQFAKANIADIEPESKRCQTMQTLS